MSETDLLGAPLMTRSAYFPKPGIRRSITRDWAPGPRAFVLGCNPSNGGIEDDPTILWWTRWFRHWGFGGFDAGNLYSFVSPDPYACRRRVEAIWDGQNWHDRDELMDNLSYVVETAKRADQVFVCYGAIAWDRDWIDHVLEEIQSGTAPWPDLWCWRRTGSGAPTHPMARGKHRLDPLTPALLFRSKHGERFAAEAAR